MKLYYAINTCSLSPHIILRELSLPFDLVRVNNKTKRLDDDSDFLAINPKGYVAALELDDGSILTEGPAILQYLGDTKPGAGLVPPPETFERVRLQEALNFITSELHAGSSPLFNKDIQGPTRAIFEQKLFKRLDYVEAILSQQSFFFGQTFSVADAYLFTVLTWAEIFSISLTRWSSIRGYMSRIAERSTVKAAIAAEVEAESRSQSPALAAAKG